MIEYLQELGYTDSEGRGLSFQEIKAWSEMTGVNLSSWEAATLKQLSSDIAIQAQKTDVNEPTPYKRGKNG